MFHPAAKQAVIAVGAVHRRMELGITPEAFEYCDFAMRAYASAMHNLNEAFAMADPKSLELAMVVPVLLSLFETFQDNTDEASKHLVGWLKILFDRQFQRVGTSSVRTNVILNKENLLDLFARLESQAVELFKGVAKIDEQALNNSLNGLPEVPTFFATIEKARDLLFTLLHCFQKLEQECQGDQFVWLRAQQNLGIRLLEWSCVFADHSKRFISEMQRESALAARLLRIYRQAACLFLLMQSTDRSTKGESSESVAGCYSSTLQTTRDVYTAHFTRLIWRAESISNPTNNVDPNRDFERLQLQLGQPTLTIDNGTSSPQNIASVRSRSSNLLQQVAALLRNTPECEKIWKIIGAYGVAERLGELEGNVLSTWTAAYREELKATAMDIIVFLEQRKLLVRYCIPDTSDASLVWTQEWMTF